MDKGYSYKSEYLYKAIEDTTNTIRFLDTKVGAVFIGISICLTLIQLSTSSISRLYGMFKNNTFSQGLFIALFVSYAILVVLSIIYCFKTIKARSNINIQTGDYKYNQLWYINTSLQKDSTIFLGDYFDKLEKMSKKDCILSILSELLKLSTIRTVKLRNLNLSIMFFMWSMFPLFIIYTLMLLLQF